MKRRDFLKVAEVMATGTALGTQLNMAAGAATPEQVVVMTWGGLWGDSMRKGVDAHFERATGIKVV